MLFDTHSHIYSEEFNGEVDDVVNRAIGAGVTKILLPNIDSSTIKLMLDLADRYPSTCYPMLGLHPTSVKDDYLEELELMEYWLGKRTFYGIGEIGIDLYWDSTFIEQQIVAFRKQLNFAKELKLPVSIHMRDSYNEVIEQVKKEYTPDLKGVFHCFSGNIDQAKEVVDLGFKIGVGGTVTFKNSGVDRVIAQLQPEDILLETDSPYLAPVPFRGKRNESAHLLLIANKVAELLVLPVARIAEITTKTASELFKIS
jgi:TatD DNase family protein